MARNTTKPGLKNRERERALSSPVARAFVRTVVARRGITEAQARQIYLDYLNGVRPTHPRRPRENA
jgi:cation transport regulator ChaC